RVVEQRHHPDHEPAVLAIVAAEAYLELTRDCPRQNLIQPLGARHRRVVGMNDETRGIGAGWPRISVGGDLLPGDAGVLMPALVEIVHGAVRTKAPSLGRDGVDDRPQTVFRALEVRFGLP